MITFEAWQERKINSPKVTLSFDASDCREEDNGSTTYYFGTLYLKASAPGFEKRSTLDLDHRTDREMYPWAEEASEWFANILGLSDEEPDNETYVPGGFSYQDSIEFVKNMMDKDTPPSKPLDFKFVEPTEFDINMGDLYERAFEHRHLADDLFRGKFRLGGSGECTIDYASFMAARQLVQRGKVDKAIEAIKSAISSARVSVD